MNKYFYFVLLSILTVISSIVYYIYSNNTKPYTPPVAVENNKTTRLINKKFIWVKSELELNSETIIPSKKDSYSIYFEKEGNVIINTDCNGGFGKFEIEGLKISFGNITSTEKYCPDSQEGIFYNQLISAQEFSYSSDEVNRGELVLRLKNGKMFLIDEEFLEQVNGAVINPLIGKEYTWLRTELKNNRVVLPVTQDKFKLTFSEDMKFTLVTDCNTNGGMYVVNEKNLTFTEIIATRMYCEKSQEEVFIRDFQKTSSFEILPDETLILNIADNSGRIYFR